MGGLLTRLGVWIMNPSPWSALVVALALSSVSGTLGVSLSDAEEIPDGIGRFATPLGFTIALLILGRWRVRVALWIQLVLSVIGVVAGLAMPEAWWWRFALVALDALAAFVCARGLFGTDARGDNEERGRSVRLEGGETDLSTHACEP
jgi:hypothetical protein